MLHDPFMVLDNVGLNGTAIGIPRRVEDETLLDQPAGRTVEIGIAA
jgi:hypothetical protein